MREMHNPINSDDATLTRARARVHKANDKNLLTTYGNISKSTRQNPQAAARQTHAHAHIHAATHRLRRRQRRSGRVDKRQRLTANGGVQSQQAQAQRKRATGESNALTTLTRKLARSLTRHHLRLRLRRRRRHRHLLRFIVFCCEIFLLHFVFSSLSFAD